MLSIRLNGESCSVPPGTIADLLVAQGVQRRRGVAVAVNGEVVPASAWQERHLGQGDDVEIVKPIGGG